MELSGHLEASATLPPEKRLDGPQNMSGRFGEKKNLPCLFSYRDTSLEPSSPWPSRCTEYANMAAPPYTSPQKNKENVDFTVAIRFKARVKF